MSLVMSHRDRILAAARKQRVDKLPFGARIDVWYNYHFGHGTLPEKYKGWNMVEILRDQGAGAQVRHLRIWKVEYDELELVTHEDPPYAAPRSLPKHSHRTTSTAEQRLRGSSVSGRQVSVPSHKLICIREPMHPILRHRSSVEYR